MPRKILEEENRRVLEAVSLFPQNMKKAADWTNLPFNTFVYRAKRLGVYAPNPSQRDARQAVARSKMWDDCSRREKRRRVFEEQSGKCAICGISDWLGETLTLELDHISGNSDDNRRENLRFLCPSCHSNTPTYRNLNRCNHTEISDMVLTEALRTNESIRGALHAVGLTGKGGNYVRAKRLKEQMGE